MYQFIWTAITKCHRLAGLETEIYFLTVLETESLRSRCQHIQVLVKAFFLVCTLRISSKCNYLPKSQLQILLHWGLQFQHRDLGGDRIHSIALENSSISPSTQFFFFKVVLAIIGLLHFHVNLETVCQFLHKVSLEFWLGLP